MPAWVVPSPLLPVPADAGGPTFTRRQDVLVHLDGDEQAQYTGSRIKILQPTALELGNITIAWNPAAGAPIVHELKVYRDGQPIDVLQTTAFEVLRREDRLEASTLDGILTAVLHVPDLRVGDELEVDLTIFGNDPTMGRLHSGLLLMAPNPAPGRYRLGLGWSASQKPTIRQTADMGAAAKSDAHAIEFRFDDPPAAAPPNQAPPRFQWQRVVQFSDFADWAAVSRLFAPFYAKAATLAPGSPLTAEAHRIAAAHVAPLDRAAAALKLVQQDVRYTYVGLNGGNLQPAAAEMTWQRRYGDCKAKTALLLALLGQLGIAAEAVLVNTSGNDDGLEQRLPMPQLFDHVLVRARIDGRPYWLDGTLPPVAPPALEPVYPISRVLPLSLAGTPLERLPWHPAAVPEEIHLFDADARAGFDKPARVTMTSVIRGIPGLRQDAQLSVLSPSQRLAVFRQNALGGVFQSIDDVQWRFDEKAGASVLRITGSGMLDWDDQGAGSKGMALIGGGFSPPDRRVRPAGQDQTVPYYSKPEFECYATTIRLPASTKPQQWSAKPSFVQRLFGRTYYRAWELRDGAIRMVRASRVDQPEIDPATAARDDARIGGFDNSMGYITWDPAGIKADVGQGEHVPAPDEIDWTAAVVPCMPSAPPAARQIASVNGSIVTEADLAAEITASGMPAGNTNLEQSALAGIVNRRLLLAALPVSSPADLSYLSAATRRAEEIRLLQESQQAQSAALPQPNAAQLAVVRAAHAGALSGRETIKLDQLGLDLTPDQWPKLKLIEVDHDLTAVARHLSTLGIAFTRGSAELDTVAIPPSFKRAVDDLPLGEPFLIPWQGKLAFNAVVSRTPIAPAGEDADRAVRLLWQAETMAHKMTDQIRTLRRQATITFAPRYEAARTIDLLETSEPAQPADPAPSDLAAAIGPDPRTALPRSAQPVGAPASWLGSDDYPLTALQLRDEGVVQAGYRIGIDGRVDQCTILKSSGSPSLDSSTCRLLAARARYWPARDGRGKSVPQQATIRFNWVLPDSAPVSAPAPAPSG